MLNYLKDGNGIPAVDETSQQVENTPDSSQEYLTVAQHGKTARQGTIILMILFVVGGLGVWFMIQKVVPAQVQAASEEETQEIDLVLAQLDSFQNQVSGQMDSVVGRFYQASELGQIEVQELKKNPFCIEASQAEEKKEEKKQELEKQQQRRMQIEAEAAQLDLFGITRRDQGNCCMINDKILFVGNQINGFTVQSISTQKVRLEKDGVVTELSMQ